ncbi:MAG: GTPase HflX [Candidatus Dadabacteria bacterium]|nr:MAG: GTPase HflX [Candidatus Dadabacteria bacterium]
MTQKVKGNTKGLAPSQLRAIHRLFERKLAAESVVGLTYARELYQLADSIGRRIGVLISREGRIEEVFIGTREILYLPTLGRYRLGRGRLRRLRLVYSEFGIKQGRVVIPQDIYTDLEKLRLDMVVAVHHSGNKTPIAYAHIIPAGKLDTKTTRTEYVYDLGQFKFDFVDFISDLENQIEKSESALVRTDRPGAILVGVYNTGIRQAQKSISELKALADTAGVNVVDTVIQRRTPDPKTILGKGKLEEVVLLSLRLGAEMIIFDTEIKPAQWRIITNRTELKILDRSMLILDIFAQHAKSSDGRLQVELAQLKYNLPRLVEKDAGLSRLTGGIGGRGPGETKLEIGRRRTRERIRSLELKIDKLSRQRELRRSRRKKGNLPLVAIVGYTNAGKSTLFNALTKSNVVAEDKLFATLDPAQRRVSFSDLLPAENGSIHTAVFSDTVGFINDLPAELYNAFRATLEELYDAALLMHIVDISDQDALDRYHSVNRTIADMGLSDIQQLVVLNKVDMVSQEKIYEMKNATSGIPVSAVTRSGIDILRKKLCKSLFKI